MTSPADRLREARLAAGYDTATDAARAFGWTPSTYLGHENGSRGLQIEAAQRYARAFRASWSWILEGDSTQPAQLAVNVGIPVVATLGYSLQKPEFASSQKVIPVGVEGFSNEQLFAFEYKWPHDKREDFIVCTSWTDDWIVNDDIVIIGRPEGKGYLILSYQAYSPFGERTEFAYGLSAHFADTSKFEDPVPLDAILAEPGAEILGIRVAEYRDYKRQRFIDAMRR